MRGENISYILLILDLLNHFIKCRIEAYVVTKLEQITKQNNYSEKFQCL